MAEIGVFTPEQARLLWQDYLTRQQLQPSRARNLPERRNVSEVSPHRVFIKNTEAETIPPYACVQITGVEVVGGRTALTVAKPTTTDGDYLFNSQYEIKQVADGQLGVGWAYRYGVVIALGDEPSEVGEVYQPIVDSWEIEAGGDLFEVYGRHDAASRALIGRFAFAGGGATNAIIGHGVITQAVCDEYYVEVDPDAATTWVNGCQQLPVDDTYDGTIRIYDPCPDVTGKMAGWTEAELLGAVVQFYEACNMYTGEEKYFIIDICVGLTCDEVA